MTTLGRRATLLALIAFGCVPASAAIATHETESRFIDTLSQVEGSADEGINEVNGQSLPHSLAMEPSCDDTEYVEFNLGRDWTRFTATVGQDDESESGETLFFEIYEDGQQVWSSMLGLGQSAPVDLDVTNTLRLRLAVTGSEVCASATGVYGSATLYRPMAHRHERTVTLSLSEHLRVSGTVKVADGVSECVAGAVVKVQVRDYYDWDTLTRITTASDGTFSADVRDRKAKFRAIVLPSSVGATYPEHVCLKAKSPVARHKH